MSNTKKLDLFIPITKVDEEQRLVYGCLAQEELDNSGEVFDYASSKPNFEKWSNDQFKVSNGLSKGNVRSMHTSIAAGKLTDMSFDDSNKRIEGCAKVVDDNEWKKVLEGVYTGFSMGGRYEKRWQENGETRYTAIPVEMSLVDKPCITSAVFGGMVKHDTFLLVKADGTTEQREFLRKEQERDENGRFAGGDGGQGSGHNSGDEAVERSRDLGAQAGGDGESKDSNPFDPKTESDHHAAWNEGHDAASDYMKSDKGSKTMYVPTNDEILPVAQAMAKADGKDESAWLDYVQPATDQLIAEKGDNPFADGKKKPEHTDEDCKAGDDCDKCADKASKADTGDTPKIDPEDTDTGSENPDGNAVVKVTPPGVKQLWTASDGKGFEKKDECIAHEEALVKAAGGEQSLADMLKAAAANVATLAEGGVPVVPETVVEVEPLDVRAEKFAKFLSDPQVIEKSVYNVSRTANALSDIGSLYRSVSAEAGREGDGSSLPASLMEIVEKLGQTLIDMATEEVGEMMARLKAPGDGPVVYDDYYCELAASTMGLEKADATEFFTKAISVSDQDLARIQKIHDHSVALGATCEDDDSKEGAGAKDDDETTKMAKAAGFDSPVDHLKDQLAKRDKELSDLAPLVKSLSDDVARLMALPRASAPRLNVVSKSGEAAEGTIEQTPVQKAVAALAGLPPEELAREAFKLSFQNGKSINL